MFHGLMHNTVLLYWKCISWCITFNKQTPGYAFILFRLSWKRIKKKPLVIIIIPVCPFKLVQKLTDFYETWYERHFFLCVNSCFKLKYPWKTRPLFVIILRSVRSSCEEPLKCDDVTDSSGRKLCSWVDELG